MAEVKPRLRVPATAKAGEIVTIKTLVSHPMESGQRKTAEGVTIPRKILNRFECRMDGVLVFFCDLEPAMSANPYLEFTVRVDRSSTLQFSWTDDDGTVIRAEDFIAVV